MAIDTSGDLQINDGTLYLPDVSGTDGGALVWDEATGKVSIGAKPGEGGGGGGGTDATKVGDIRAWSRSVVPDDCVLADGSTYDEDDYPELYAVAVAEQTAGNPLWTANTSAKTFTVPDLRNRFIYGKGAKSLGATGGAETHTLTINETPSHSHPPGNLQNFTMTVGSGAQSYNIVTITNVGNSQVGIGNRGGGQPHNNMPPYVVLAFIVQARPIVPVESIAGGSGIEIVGGLASVKAGNGLSFDDGGALITATERVTSLPGSPEDGDEVYLQPDPSNNPGVLWHMRYDASADAWDWLGGTPLYFETPGGVVAFTSSAFTDVSGHLLTYTFPYGGAWRVTIGSRVDSGSTPSGQVEMAARVGATALVSLAWRGADWQDGERTRTVSGIVASSTVRTQFATATGEGRAIGPTRLAVRPVRIG